MKKIIATITLASFTGAIQVLAQPVITSSSSVPPVGTVDSIYVAPASAAPGAGGAGVTWNLSSLSFSLGGTITIVTASTTPYTSTFPSSNFCMQLTMGAASYNYNRISSSGIENLATTYAGVGTGTDYSPNPRLNMPYPFHYADSVIDTYQAVGSAAEVESLIYDGYGTLITPFHTYPNVIRVKENYGGSDYHYAWYTVSPLMLILDYSNTGSNYVLINQFPTPSNTTVVPGAGPSVLVFPNPANDEVNIILDVPAGISNASLTLSDATGRVIRQTPIVASQTTIPRRGLTGGLYFYQVYNNGIRIASGKLIFR